MSTSKSYASLKHADQAHENIFAINWTIFNVCNYSCSYCRPSLYNGSLKGPPLPAILNFIQEVIQLKSPKTVFFEFTGGEVTFHPNFTKILTFIKENGGETGIISNGSRSSEWWSEHAGLIDHACLSFHAERGNEEHFYDVVKSLNDKVSLHINMMMLPERFDDLMTFACRLAKDFQDLPVFLQPLFEDFSGPMYAYTDTQKEVFIEPRLPNGPAPIYSTAGRKYISHRGNMVKTHFDGQSKSVMASELINRGENSWLNWFCYTGIENLVIDPKGNIFRGICGIGGLVGNITDAPLNLPVDPVLCKKKRCTCAFDVTSTKINTFKIGCEN